MARSKSSKKWLQAHFNDVYVQRAQAEGKRSRAVYKLKQIDEKNHLLQPGMTIVDLGAAPGGWSQYIAERLQGKGTIIALDRLPMEPLHGVTFLEGDFTEDAILSRLMPLIPTDGVDWVFSDMAPNLSGNVAMDMPRFMYLAELALDFAQKVLKPGGGFLIKLFHGAGFDEFVKLVRNDFKRVVVRKPEASRAQSRETYLLARGFQQRENTVV
jgi:23S rRNA (uridine2552-2'-O)-methyltransferase